MAFLLLNIGCVNHATGELHPLVTNSVNRAMCETVLHPLLAIKAIEPAATLSHSELP